MKTLFYASLVIGVVALFHYNPGFSKVLGRYASAKVSQFEQYLTDEAVRTEKDLHEKN